MVEREVGTEQVLLREGLHQVGGDAVGVNASVPGCEPAPSSRDWRIPERPQRHQLIVRSEVLLLQSGQVLRPLLVPCSELRRS